MFLNAPFVRLGRVVRNTSAPLDFASVWTHNSWRNNKEIMLSKIASILKRFYSRKGRTTLSFVNVCTWEGVSVLSREGRRLDVALSIATNLTPRTTGHNYPYFLRRHFGNILGPHLWVVLITGLWSGHFQSPLDRRSTAFRKVGLVSSLDKSKLRAS
jgi:hypothetical protein